MLKQTAGLLVVGELQLAESTVECRHYACRGLKVGVALHGCFRSTADTAQMPSVTVTLCSIGCPPAHLWCISSA